MQIFRTNESVYIRREFNSHGIGLEPQHGPRFIVLEHQYGRRFIVLEHQYGHCDVFWKRLLFYHAVALSRAHFRKRPALVTTTLIFRISHLVAYESFTSV